MPQQNEKPAEQRATSYEEPPDGGYGWVVVAAVFWNNAHQWGIASAYGVFLSHYLSTSALPGGTPLKYALIGGLIISQALATAPIAANITRIYGVRATLLCGVLLETAALIGASFASQIWHLFLSQGICLGWGIGLQYISTVGIIPQWFAKRRGLASGIAAAGSGTGGLIYSLAANAMIKTMGIAWTYRTLAVVAFTVNTVCAFLFKDRNKQVGAKTAAFDLRLFRQVPYWLFLGWCFLSIIAFAVVLFSFDDYARSVGLSAQQGSVVTALLNLGQGLGRPAVGLLSDRIGRLNMASLATFLSALLCFVGWTTAKSYGGLLTVSFLLGTVFGAFWTVTGPVAAEVLNLADLPPGLTMMWLVCVLPATVAEVIALKLRKPTGNQYLDVQLFTAAMFLGATLCMLGARTWRVATWEKHTRQVEQEEQVVDESNPSPGDVISTNISTAGLRYRRCLKSAFKWERV